MKNHLWGHETENRERLFDILSRDTQNAFVLFTLKDRSVEYVSANMESLLGITAEEIKKDISVLWETQDVGGDHSEEIERLEAGRSISLERRCVHRKTGELVWIAFEASPFEEKQTKKAVIVLRDRTQVHEMDQELADAAGVAESANRARSSFLSNISHDIRTPVNAMIGLCTLLERDVADPEMVKSHTRKMMASCQHLLGLINDALDMSKMEAGKMSLNIAEINLAQIVEDLVIVMVPQAYAKKQEFEVSIADVTSEHLLGDGARISRILVNVLANAIKYTPEGGRVELTILEMPQKTQGFAHMRFIVKDSGKGFSKGEMQSIFSPYARGQDTVLDDVQSNGLSMAITKSLVELMEGNISVESEIGTGSTFTIDLDLRVQNREPAQRAWEKYGIKRVLVVDDELDNCVYVSSAMERSGLSAEYVLSGAAALDMIEKGYADGKAYDLILMDLKMSDMDGVETTRRIRENISEEMPIVAFTAYDWDDVEGQARAAGIDGFMSKPFFLSNFETCLENLYNEPLVVDAEEMGILKGKNILVAEDNELNSEILRELLDMQGATCAIEEDGEKVVRRFQESEQGTYDFILMDMQMPVMDGYEATRAIRACRHPQAETIPIIAMTADAFAEDVRRSVEAGMNAHVPKPLDLKRLEEAVRKVMV